MPIQKVPLKMKIGRLWRTWVKGYVLLHRLKRDPETGGYMIVTEETTKEELPIHAVHQTGKRGHYWVDEIRVIHPFNTDDNGFTAIDLNLWMESTAFDEAMAMKGTGLAGLDSKKTIMGVAIAVVAVIVIYVVMQAMA